MPTGADMSEHHVLSSVADIWRTLGGQVRTGADMSEHHVLSSVPDIWRTFGRQVRTGADRSDHHVISCVVDNWRTGGDKWRTDGQVADICPTFGPSSSLRSTLYPDNAKDRGE